MMMLGALRNSQTFTHRIKQLFLNVVRFWDAIYEETGGQQNRGSNFITLHRPPFLNAVLTSPFRPSKVSQTHSPLNHRNPNTRFRVFTAQEKLCWVGRKIKTNREGNNAS